jgi:hypothetical protein
MPNDGTFNQGAAFKRCQEKSIKYGCSFGYDLSAATDRLPLKLQIAILSSFIGKEIAEKWAHILVGRDYVYSSEEKGIRTFQPIKYEVGQPMGALSS